MSMERFDRREFKRGSKLTAEDVNNIPRHANENIRSNTNTQVSRFGNNVMLRTKGGSASSIASGLRIETVLTLPAIPTSGCRMVFWTSTGGGTGDNQVWMAYAGQTAYTPMQKYTTKSGVPV